jgi:hypothetical protein
VDWLPVASREVASLDIFLGMLFLATGKLCDRKPGINSEVDTCPALIEFNVLLPLIG